MNTPATATGEQLANALHALGVKFIMGGESTNESLHKQPARLIAALAESSESRLRLSLIPLFLEHPEFAVQVRSVADHLNPSARLTLQCYYTAAVWLQQKYHSQLDGLIGKKSPLPDYFSRELGLENTNDPESNLRLLAKRHQALSGAQVNWLGTYQHAVQVWIKGLEIQYS
ncbi:MAG TPA: hypothetical protein VIN60_00925 [Anaerolineales bacterium]